MIFAAVGDAELAAWQVIGLELLESAQAEEEEVGVGVGSKAAESVVVTVEGVA